MRKVHPVKITADNRDHDKVYIIKEFSASQAEWLAVRAFQALVKSGVELDGVTADMGMAGLAQMGFSALGKIDPELVKPLLDEMLSGITFCPDPVNNPTFTRSLVEDDIEEVSTYMMLRMEVFQLHTGFSMTAKDSASSAAVSTTTSPNSNTTGTSRPRSGRSSPQAVRR